jgi:hypothetical protein
MRVHNSAGNFEKMYVGCETVVIENLDFKD